MITLRNISALLATGALAISLVGCGSMSSRDRSTAVGAGVGALGGAVLGGTAATIGGAAVGAVIGNQVEINARRNFLLFGGHAEPSVLALTHIEC